MGWTAADLTLVLVLTAVGLRWALFVVLALVDSVQQRARSEALRLADAELPPVTVLVPAYNEAQVIRSTVERALASDYPSLRVVVIDDGSQDGTAQAAQVDDERVTVLVQQPNQGKAAALNRGLAQADTELVVTVDADTWLHPRAVRCMVESLLVCGADAVASNVRVGNRVNLWTRWQSLEYVSGLNIDRRAQAVLGVITTVPGAASAWRREVVLAAGGYTRRTLTEDTDLTLTLLREGRHIVFDSRAVAFTEAPQTGGALYRQRLRWLHGNLQCAWHHSRAGGGPWRFLFVALPNLWFAHLGVYLLLPVTLLLTALGRSQSAAVFLGWLFAALFIVDITAVLLAYLLDRGDWRDLLWAPSQRVGYPAFLWGVFAVVALRILRRAPTAWNKLDRTGL